MLTLLSLLKGVRFPTFNEFLIAASFMVTALFASWVHRGKIIAQLEVLLAEKPKVEYVERIVEKKVVVRGPVRIVKVQNPDGTVTTTTDRAGETIASEADHDRTRNETPAGSLQPKVKTWGIGGQIDLKNQDRGNVFISKSLGPVTFMFGHNVGKHAIFGDSSAGFSIKLF